MLVLASASERRKEILEKLGLDFIQCVPDVEEAVCEDAYKGVMKNALAKARCCAAKHPEHVVLGFDTVVLLDEKVLGKPATRDAAYQFLSTLSGKAHTVVSGIAVVCLAKKVELVDFEETKVYFRKLSEAEIEWYLSTNEWVDKAGGYGIQGKASLFVERIEGCYFNVVGLPVAKTYKMLVELEIPIFPRH
ncbi:MAG: Maf family protein [Thermoplasmata archaeon]